jgi:acetoin utilization deacetylase AcuC-like enzyme
VATAWRTQGGAIVEPRAATRDELLAVHSAEHIAAMESTAGRAVMLDPDTFTSPESEAIARLAAGAVCLGVEHALARRAPAFALVRPPGHHAERDRAMGFCLYNNIAVAAAAARARGTDRVAIVDIDVHHGNGSQWMFYDDPAVLYVSSHQYPFYPGTGAAHETGTGAGKGYTVNIPLEAGATDADYLLAYTAIVRPVLEQFQPALTLISAGFDAHERDPLASMRMSTEGFGAIVGGLASVARRHGSLALVTEGGYDLTALEESLDASLTAIQGTGTEVTASHSAAAPRGERAIAAVRAAQHGFWRL